MELETSSPRAAETLPRVWDETARSWLQMVPETPQGVKTVTMLLREDTPSRALGRGSRCAQRDGATVMTGGGEEGSQVNSSTISPLRAEEKGEQTEPEEAEGL